jgi:hypothetical protein
MAIACLVLSAAATAQGTLFVKADKVGVNEENPTVELDVLGALQVKKQAATANIRFNNGAGQTWNFQNNGTSGNFAIRDLSAGATPFKIEPGASANLFTLTGGTVQILGTQVHPDYVFESAYDLESIEDHAEYMFTNKHLPAVGAGRYNEAGEPIIQLGASSAGMLEELEKAHIYIAQLNDALKSAQQQNEELAERLARIEASLDK